MKKPIVLLLLMSVIITSTAHTKSIFCKKKKKKKSQVALVQPSFVPGPAMIVYKTNKNYNKNVPVALSVDKSSITSYPAPSDVSEKSIPTTLVKGYLADNRGIGINTAFTSITYTEYSSMQKAPELAKLQGLIIDNDPIVEMYNCGLKASYSNPEEQLNAIIEADKLSEICKKLK